MRLHGQAPYRVFTRYHHLDRSGIEQAFDDASIALTQALVIECDTVGENFSKLLILYTV